MYYLMITTDQECQNHEIIAEAQSYAEMCKLTIQFKDSDDVRNAYYGEISAFLRHNKGKKTYIVVVESYKHNNETKYYKYKAIYQKHQKQYEELIEKNNLKNVSDYSIAGFWASLIDPNQFHSNQMLNEEFLTYSMRFKALLKKIYGYEIKKWDFNDTNIDNTDNNVLNFNSFINKIKGNDNWYYEGMRSVIEAFDLWKRKCRLMGVNPKEVCGDYMDKKLTKKERYEAERDAVVVADNALEITDEFSYTNSSEFVTLKPYIDKEDGVFLKTFLEKYPHNSLTQEELDIIQGIINRDHSKSKRK